MNKIFYQILKERLKLNEKNMALRRWHRICTELYYAGKSRGKIDTKVVGIFVRNTFAYKIANFARLHFPRSTTFRYQTWKLY